MDRTDANCRHMLEASGFTYDPTHDAYTKGRGGCVLRVDTILAHTELWLAQCLTETGLSGDADVAAREQVTWASALGPPLFSRRSD